MRKNLQKTFFFLLLAGILLVEGTALWAAPSPSMIKTLGRVLAKYGDEVETLGKATAKAGGRVISAAERNAWVRRMPSLANKSDVTIAGLKAIDEFAKLGSKQSRLINSLENPVRLLQMEKTAKGAWQVADAAADSLALIKTMPKAGAIKELPPHIINQAGGLFGNYAKSADAFLDMAAKGGRKALEVAGQLLAIMKENPKSSLAATLLACHIIDPEGTEELIKNFFKTHVGGVVKAGVSGVNEGASDIGMETVDKAADAALKNIDNIEEKGGEVLKRLLKSPIALGTLAVAVIVLLLIVSSTFRKTAGLAVKLLLGWINRRLETAANKQGGPGAASADDGIRAKTDIYGDER